MPSMQDPVFGGTVVYVCEHNDNGVLGVVINKPTDMMVKANQTPGLANNLTTFRANVPQLWLDVDRVKAKSMTRRSQRYGCWSSSSRAPSGDSSSDSASAVGSATIVMKIERRYPT